VPRPCGTHRSRAHAFAPVAAAVLAELDDEVARLVSTRDLATTTRVLRALMDLDREDIEI
jgi:hypothetical protein